MCSAATRSACPSAGVKQAATTSPLRFSIRACPMKQSLAAWPFAIKPRLGIGSRGVAVVRALLAVKIRLPVASASVHGRFVRAILRPETLHRRPGFDQRAVDREVVGAEKPLHSRMCKNCAQQLGRDVAFQQALAVLGKN